MDHTERFFSKAAQVIVQARVSFGELHREMAQGQCENDEFALSTGIARSVKEQVVAARQTSLQRRSPDSPSTCERLTVYVFAQSETAPGVHRKGLVEQWELCQEIAGKRDDESLQQPASLEEANVGSQFLRSICTLTRLLPCCDLARRLQTRPDSYKIVCAIHADADQEEVARFNSASLDMFNLASDTKLGKFSLRVTYLTSLAAYSAPKKIAVPDLDTSYYPLNAQPPQPAVYDEANSTFDTSIWGSGFISDSNVAEKPERDLPAKSPIVGLTTYADETTLLFKPCQSSVEDLQESRRIQCSQDEARQIQLFCDQLGQASKLDLKLFSESGDKSQPSVEQYRKFFTGTIAKPL